MRNVDRATLGGNLRIDQVLESATRLFTEKGYEAASVRDIAADLEIRPSSLYHHFPGKQHILFARLTVVGIALTAYHVCVRGQTQTEAISPSAKATILQVEISQRIASLRDTLRSGDPLALDEFWKEAKQAGTPLVERLRESPDESL